jgi:urease accessory protein
MKSPAVFHSDFCILTSAFLSGGAAATRITAEDFVTPPEFAGLRLAHARGTGQIGGVRLELVPGGDKTRLGACYQQVPLRVLPPFQFPPDPAALLYLLNPTAGLLDGDAHLVEVTAQPGTRAVVTGQSANRVHPAVAGFSTQQWKVHVCAGAELVVLPGPTIPYQGCRYYQRAVIDLELGARLIWGDIWLPGRYARGTASEWFQFDRIVQELEVRRAGELVFRERFDWKGPWGAEEIRWFLGSGQASGSLFATGSMETRPETGQVAQAVLGLASGDSCVRWCGPPPVVTAEVVSTAMDAASRWSGGDVPWLLASRNLAPNHWFAARPE